MMEIDKNKRLVAWFGTALWLLMLLDIVSTKIALKSEFVYEANSILAPIINNDIFIFIKFLGTALIVYLMYNAIQKSQKIAKAGMVMILFFYGLVLINNLYWIMRYQ